MRKIIALFAIVALASCGSEPANADVQKSDSTVVASDSTVTDTITVDSVK
jgi:uncharacterized protein YcfL